MQKLKWDHFWTGWISSFFAFALSILAILIDLFLARPKVKEFYQKQGWNYSWGDRKLTTAIVFLLVVFLPWFLLAFFGSLLKKEVMQKRKK